jgi:hypothetical protein
MKMEKVNKSSLPVVAAYLHQAIMIDGKTEQTLNKTKVPTIKSMEWTANGFLVIKAKKTYVLPGAAVSNSILEE